MANPDFQDLDVRLSRSPVKSSANLALDPTRDYQPSRPPKGPHSTDRTGRLVADPLRDHVGGDRSISECTCRPLRRQLELGESTIWNPQDCRSSRSSNSRCKLAPNAVPGFGASTPTSSLPRRSAVARSPQPTNKAALPPDDPDALSRPTGEPSPRARQPAAPHHLVRRGVLDGGQRHRPQLGLRPSFRPASCAARRHGLSMSSTVVTPKVNDCAGSLPGVPPNRPLTLGRYG